MSKELPLADLKKQRRAILSFWLYFLGATLGITCLAALCGSASTVLAVDGFLLTLSLVVILAVYLLKRIDFANAQIKQHLKQHSFRLDDEHPPKFTGVEV